MDSSVFKKGLVLALDVIFPFTILIALVKLSMSTLTIPDGLGIFVILTVSLAARIVDFKYPKRPDLYADMLKAQMDLEDLKTKLSNLNFDVTGLKFGLKHKN